MESLVTNDVNPKARTRSDSELVVLAQGGNKEALAALFQAHKTKVYSICLRMTSNPAEAEDLTQEAFLQVLRKLATFRGESTLSTWLHRVAVNTVLMHFRKKRPGQLSLEEPGDRNTGAPKLEYGKVDERLSTSIDRIALTRALKELPAGYMNIFLLHEVKGYEHSEIARLIHCSVGNSKSQLHKARSKMRELLGVKRSQYGLTSAATSNALVPLRRTPGAESLYRSRRAA